MRRKRFKTYLRRLREVQDDSLVGESFLNGDRRMEALFSMAIRDKEFWEKEVLKRVT